MTDISNHSSLKTQENVPYHSKTIIVGSKTNSNSVISSRTSVVAQMVENLPAMGETWVHSLSWENPLEEGMATHSSVLAWRIPMAEEPGRLQSIRLQKLYKMAKWKVFPGCL